jgi:hypothetical protein
MKCGTSRKDKKKKTVFCLLEKKGEKRNPPSSVDGRNVFYGMYLDTSGRMNRIVRLKRSNFKSRISLARVLNASFLSFESAVESSPIYL